MKPIWSSHSSLSLILTTITLVAEKIQSLTLVVALPVPDSIGQLHAWCIEMCANILDSQQTRIFPFAVATTHIVRFSWSGCTICCAWTLCYHIFTGGKALTIPRKREWWSSLENSWNNYLCVFVLLHIVLSLWMTWHHRKFIHATLHSELRVEMADEEQCAEIHGPLDCNVESKLS